MSSCLGAGMGNDCRLAQGSFWGDEHILKVELWKWLHNSVNLQNVTEFKLKMGQFYSM